MCHEDQELYDLATSILKECKQEASLSNLDTAIFLLQEALNQRPLSHPLRSDSKNDLAAALVIRFDWTGHIQDLTEAFEHHHEVFAIARHNMPRAQGPLWSGGDGTSGDGIEASDLTKLARDSLTEFIQSTQLSSIQTAVTLYREALRLRPQPHAERPRFLRGLAAALSMQFRHIGQLQDLEESLALLCEAILLCPEPHSDRRDLLISLSANLLKKYQLTTQLPDLFNAAVLLRDALVPVLNGLAPGANNVHSLQSHYGQPASLSNAADIATRQFQESGLVSYLDAAVRHYSEAIALLTPSDPMLPTLFNNLANTFQSRFDQTGQISDLNKAVARHREALKLDPDRLYSLHGLGSALWYRFHHAGQDIDLNEAVALLRENLSLLSTSHSLRPSSLGNLGNALVDRFIHSGQHVDLDEAAALQQEALELLPVLDPHRPHVLANLARALSTRFRRTGLCVDLDKAVSVYLEALELRPPSHPDRPTSLHNLGAVLMDRFGQTGQSDDLDRAIVLFQELYEMLSPSHPLRPQSVSHFASALTMRFDRSNHCEDLDKAVALHREALQLLPGSNPNRSSSLHNFAKSLHRRFSRIGQRTDLEEAVKLYREATTSECASASDRFAVACHWVDLAESTHESAFEAYQVAIELIHRLATLGLDLQSRHEALASGPSGLARNAAACAIRSDQFSLAVTLLEKGRGVFWAQALRLRAPLDDLKSAAPSLARKLEDLAHKLEEGSRRDVSRNTLVSHQHVIIMEKEVVRYRQLDADWLTTLEEVRKVNGFHDFLRSSEMSSLQRAASSGPVVILNASKHGCAALIVTLAAVKHVPIPLLDVQHVRKLAKLIRFATTIGGRDVPSSESALENVEYLVRQIRGLLPEAVHSLVYKDRYGRVASGYRLDSDGIFRLVLAVLWEAIVKPVFCSLSLERTESPPRLWWCPTGPFVFLPMHAAGTYSVEHSENTFDYVISSYTPTLQTLLKPPADTTNPFKMMIVVHPGCPNYGTLPSTIEELRWIKGHAPQNCLIIPHIPASVEEVLSSLQAASVVHFACHGTHHLTNPLKAALILENGQLEVSRIMEQSLPNASLAFLSACQTAMGDENCPDEVIHVATSLLFAGFRGVVATMWSIADNDGPKVADTFYATLFQPNESTIATDDLCVHPDITQAARALHLAVGKLREENCPFVRWVPFIHVGL